MKKKKKKKEKYNNKYKIIYKKRGPEERLPPGEIGGQGVGRGGCRRAKKKRGLWEDAIRASEGQELYGELMDITNVALEEGRPNGFLGKL